MKLNSSQTLKTILKIGVYAEGTFGTPTQHLRRTLGTSHGTEATLMKTQLFLFLDLCSKSLVGGSHFASLPTFLKVGKDREGHPSSSLQTGEAGLFTPLCISTSNGV